MTYLTQSEISQSASMFNRMAQAAATEGYTNPDGWAGKHARTWAASPGWSEAWESALASHPGDPEFDPGTDEAVITDSMILSETQSIGDTEGNPAP
jgi:hypothetical protein